MESDYQFQRIEIGINGDNNTETSSQLFERYDSRFAQCGGRVAKSAKVSNAGDTASFIVTIQTPQKHRLTGYSGSMLRGMLGNALKYHFCRCGVCVNHADDCFYAHVFEGRGGTGLRGSKPPPRFVIKPVIENRTDVSKCGFVLTLIGLTETEQMDVLRIWPFALQSGMGHERERCKQLKVSRYIPDELDTSSRDLTIVMTTPWLIKRSGRALNASNCTGRDILFAVNHRLVMLNRHFELSLPTVSSAKLLQYCDDISFETELKQVSWKRYSSRQGRFHPLTGIIGCLKLESDRVIDPLVLMLQAGQTVNAGGKTAFGLGAYLLRETNGS